MHSFDSSFDKFPPYDGKNVDYWTDWMNAADKISDVEDRKWFITQFLKNYNSEEVLIRAAANQYYDILEFTEEVSLEEVKKRYKELSLLHHPDRGKSDPEKFKLINKANRILGNEVKKIKYDLCLQEDEDSENLEYLNRKKLSKIKRVRELVDEEFGKKIELILQDELGLNNLTWEELNDYGEGRWNEKEYLKFQKTSGTEVELVKVEDFYRHVLLGTRQDEAIEHTKKYLKIFVAASILKEEIKKMHNEQETSVTPFADGARKRLISNEPTLIEKELVKVGEEDRIKKIGRIEIKIKLAEIRREEKKYWN